MFFAANQNKFLLIILQTLMELIKCTKVKKYNHQNNFSVAACLMMLHKQKYIN